MTDDFDVDAYLDGPKDAAVQGSAQASAPERGERRERRGRSGDRRSPSHRSVSRSRRHSRRSSSRDRRRKHSHSRHRRRGGRSSSRRRRSSRRRSPSRRRSSSRRRGRDRSDSVGSVNSDVGLTQQELHEKKEMQNRTRDARTCLVSQLQVKASERDVKRFFQSVCGVRKVVLLKDKHTRRSRGMGYVEVKTLEDVQKALTLNGQQFVFKDGQKGFPIIVKPSESEKNVAHRVAAAAAAAAGVLPPNRVGGRGPNPQSAPGGAAPATSAATAEEYRKRIYVGNLPASIMDDQLRLLFQEFGVIKRVTLQPEAGTSNACAYVFYENADSASLAIKTMDGQMLSGKPLNIKPVTVPLHNDPASQIHERILDYDESERVGKYGGGGIAMSAAKKIALMQNLGGGAGRELVAQHQQRHDEFNQQQQQLQQQRAVQETQDKGAIKGVWSQYLRLNNMFDPAKETDPDWDVQIQEETAEECENYGKVLHCGVDKNSNGQVYIKFADMEGAQRTAEKLHGRYFDQKMVQVEYLTQAAYAERYPGM